MRIETISDIVDEMRNCTAKYKDEAWYDQSSWANLCDRIEAAATYEKSSQVGNAAKMREALETKCVTRYLVKAMKHSVSKNRYLIWG